jgi:enoyl-CoA hydratase
VTDLSAPALEQELEREPAGEVVDGVACELSGAVALVTLSRPAMHNALALGSWTRLGDLFGGFGDEPGLRAVVVRGAGGRAFSAGADIAEFPEKRLGAERALAYNRRISGALEAVMRCPLPVVAMVGGLAVGGGCELAAACDVRIVSDDSRFGIPIGRLGVTLGYSETRALARLIGPGRLKELLFSGRLVDAHEAAAIGLVERVVPRERLAAETAELVGSIVRSAPATMRAAKLVADIWGRALTAADADVLTAAAIEAYESDALREGVAAFLERRPPSFTDSEQEGA